ncbi:MAG TPA: aldehyde dehydrogenase family protein [Acidobacteriota bacterium]|jgi:acyl-CoA reductase-like NAD-dependent aldehyde dehydrogenase
MQIGHLIDGQEVESLAGKTFPTINPATEEVLAEVADGNEADVDRAVRAARRAFDEGPWARMAPWERGRLIGKVAEVIRRRADELAMLDALDCGKPYKDNKYGDIPCCIRIFEYYGGIPDKYRGVVVPAEQGLFNYAVREPYGVVIGIVPWNYPFLNSCIKLAPALAAGNTVVLKMAEQTPLSTVELGKICLEAGIPPGVVNIVNGGPETGAALVRHPAIDKISFTGSTAVGKEILHAAADRVIPVTLELGGKSPSVVFEDADLDQAVAGVLFSSFFNAGQICTTGSRLIVQESIAEKFLQKLAPRATALRVGDPTREETDLGPLVSRAQYERVVSYLEIGQAEGAQVYLDGSTHQDPKITKGYFVWPTIYTGVKPQMRIAQEEIFGPVLSVLTFKDEAEAIELANNVVYGLAASVWTTNLGRALRAVSAIKAGMIWANTVEYWEPSVPYGGQKQSGLGEDFGMEAYRTYTKAKSVFVNLTNNKIQWGT